MRRVALNERDILFRIGRVNGFRYLVEVLIGPEDHAGDSYVVTVAIVIWQPFAIA